MSLKPDPRWLLLAALFALARSAQGAGAEPVLDCSAPPGRALVVVMGTAWKGNPMHVTCDREYVGCVRKERHLTVELAPGPHVFAAGQPLLGLVWGGGRGDRIAPATLPLSLAGDSVYYLEAGKRSAGLAWQGTLARLAEQEASAMLRKSRLAESCGTGPDRDLKEAPVLPGRAMVFVVRLSGHGRGLAVGGRVDIELDGRQVAGLKGDDRFVWFEAMPGAHTLRQADDRPGRELNVEFAPGGVYYFEQSVNGSFGFVLRPLDRDVGRLVLSACRLSK